MATLQEAINQARQAGYSEAEIQKKVQSLGGTYTPPVNSKLGLNIGITGPEALITQSNLPKPGFLQSIGNFLAPTTTANIQDVAVTSKAKKYVQSQEQNTQKLLELNKLMKKAREIGDMETYQRLAQESKRLGQASEEIEAPQFSQYTQNQAEAGLTGNIGDYLSRGLKSGAEIGSYLLPSAKALGITSVLGKGGLGTLGGAIRGYGSSGYDEGVSGLTTGAAIGGTMNLAGQGLSWLGKKISQKAIDAAMGSETKFIKRFGSTVNDIATKYGKSVNELYGPIEEKGAGGTLAKASKEAENLIQEAIKSAPQGTKISKDVLLSALDKEIAIQKEGLNTTMVRGLTKAKNEIIKKFKNDLTPEQALKLLRQANKQYTDAALKSVEKTKYELIRQSLRSTLGELFPDINDALNTQAEVITLRPVIEKEIGKVASKVGQGIVKKGFELDKPTSYPLVGDILKGLGNKVIPGAIKTIGTVLQSPLTTQAVLGGLNMPEQGQTPETTPLSPPQTNELQRIGNLPTGNLPTPEATTGVKEPILSPQGQWQWDEASQEWKPYQAKTQQAQSLTGYTPEELYDAAIKAYQAGDKNAYSQLISMYDDETKYQEKLAKAQKEKKGGGVEASIGMMEKLYGAGTDKSLSMGTRTVGLEGVKGRVMIGKKKLTDQEYVDRLNTYKTQMALVAGAINQAAGAGVLNGGEYQRLAMESFPNEYTSEAVAKAWFDNARKVLENLPEERASQLSDYLGGL